MHSFKLNNVLVKFVCLACVVVAYGCNDDTTTEVDKSTDARVLSFSLPDNSKVTNSLSKYVFSIDHLAGQNTDGIIENNDSLPLGIDINRNLLASISFSGASKAQLIYNDKEEEERKDYSPNDSINFSRGVKLEVTAYDGKTKKTYELKVNVHKEDPDSVSWTEIKNSYTGILPINKQVTFAENADVAPAAFNSFFLDNNVLNRINLQTGQTVAYSMTNPLMESMVQTPTGYYLIDNNGQLMFMNPTMDEPISISATSISVIYGYITDGSTNYLVMKEKMSESVVALNLNDHSTVVHPETTPNELATLSSFTRINNHPASMNYKATTIVGRRSGLDYLSTFQFYIFGGKLHISNDIAYALDKELQLPIVESPIVFYYNSAFWAVANVGSANSIFVSSDLGKTWHKQKSKLTIPTSFATRTESSSCVIANKYIYLFGGKIGSQYTSEIWRGKINKVDHKYYYPAK